jgi:hypothetical protein
VYFGIGVPEPAVISPALGKEFPYSKIPCLVEVSLAGIGHSLVILSSAEARIDVGGLLVFLVVVIYAFPAKVVEELWMVIGVACLEPAFAVVTMAEVDLLWESSWL